MSGQEEKDDGNEEGDEEGDEGRNETSDEGDGFCLADYFLLKKKETQKPGDFFFTNRQIT